MSSFSCPHLDSEKSYCIRLQKECVPGRKGCVLLNKVVFAVSAEQRMKKKENAHNK